MLYWNGSLAGEEREFNVKKGLPAYLKNAADWGSLTRAQRQQVLGWASTLDNYNNRLIGPGHCP